MRHWFAVHTSVGDEAKADYWLRRQQVVTWFPHYAPEWKPTENESEIKSELSRRAYFPRYLFAKVGFEQIPLVNVTPGVSTVLHIGDGPFVIPEEVMQELFKDLGPSGKLYRNRPGKPSFLGVVGQKFKFSNDSVWSSLAGQILEILVDKEAIRALFLEQLFGAEGREVEIPWSEVGELQPLTGSARN